MMNVKKIISGLLVAVFTVCLLTACKEKYEEPENTVPSPTAAVGDTVEDNGKSDLTDFPEDCDLSNEELREVARKYADYLTSALEQDEYVVTARFDEDGSIHYDGVRTNDDGTTDSITDIDVFDNERDCFAYLYNCGQVDLEGNLLVEVTEGVKEEVEQAGEEAEQLAQEALDGVLSEQADKEKSSNFNDTSGDGNNNEESSSDAAESSTIEIPSTTHEV